MANYAVDVYSVTVDHDYVIAAMATKLETIDNSKTIRHISFVKRGAGFAGFLIYDS